MACRFQGRYILSQTFDSSFETITLVLRAELKKRRYVPAQDRNDIIQDVIVRMLKGHDSFDPTRGTREGWSLSILQNLLSDRANASKCKKRRSPRKSRGSSAGGIESAERDYRLPARQSDHKDMVDLRLDVAVVLANVGDHERGLALRLERGNMSEAAAETGQSRTAQYRARSRIRDAFVQAGYGPQE